MKKSYREVERDFKEAERELREALDEAQQIALKQVQAEIDKLFISNEIKAKISPIFIRKILSNIVKHIKEIYFNSEAELKERINKQEINYDDCQRELRQSTLFNY
jgi:hypothetical protein